jgi:hypothetical protein
VAVPSRAFVGIVVFGLLASLALLPYTILVLSGYQPPPEAPYQAIFAEKPNDTGDKLVLVAATLFSMAVTVLAWRGLLARARRDQGLRHDLRRRTSEETRRPPPPPPPGYQ